MRKVSLMFVGMCETCVSGGPCMAGGGACVAGGMHGRGHAWQGVCVWQGGMCGIGGMHGRCSMRGRIGGQCSGR